MFGRTLLASIVAASLSGAALASGSVLWRHSDTGQNWIYQFEGHTTSLSRQFAQVTDLAWQVGGAGDFNGDGVDDVLWRHAQFGINWVYLTNGTDVIDSLRINEVQDLNWTVAGVGDVNGDGKDDIVWRHISTGQNWLYLMNGHQIAASRSLNTVPLDWTLEGVADLDGDGSDDLIWRNQNTGLNWAYMMNNGAIASSKPINTVALGWNIEGLADFNGDNKADILWRHEQSGDVYIYQMNGPAIANVKKVATVGSPWQVDAIHDRNSDGTADILWRNASTGVLWSYLMNGANIIGSASAGISIPTLWESVAVLDISDSTVTPQSIAINNVANPSAEIGQCIDLDATATFSNQTTQLNPAGMQWSCDGNNFTISASGNACAQNVGTTSCHVSWNNLTDSISLTATDAPVVATGFSIDNGPFNLSPTDTAQVNSTGSFSDNSTQSNPTGVSWSCDDAVASMSTSGLITANSVGTTTCRGTWQGFSDSVGVTISQVVDQPTAISVSPSSLSGSVGGSGDLSATVTFSISGNQTNPDGVDWSCANTSVATIISTDGAGSPATVTYEGAGTTDCTATIDNLSDSATVTVADVPTGIKVYLLKPASWAGCSIHHWLSPPAEDTTWPGNTMTTLTDGWCEYQFPDGQSESNVVFNDGIGTDSTKKSPDLLFTASGCWTGGADWLPLAQCNLPVEEPIVGASPGTSSFSTDSLSVTLTIKNGTGKFLLGTGDACTSGATYTDSQQITVGSSLSIGQSETLNLCGDDGQVQTVDSFTYTKVEQSTTANIDRLGVTYASNQSTFAIWSPTNVNVGLRLDGVFHRLQRVTDNSLLNDEYSSKTSDIYAVTVAGDHHLKSYNFVMNFDEQLASTGQCRYTTTQFDDPTDCYYVRDPYGIMVEPATDNNIVVDLAQTEPDGGWAPVPALNEREDAIVYEVHVRDFTIDASSGVSSDKRGKFLGMVESGTKVNGTGLSTGIDHLVELGVTHVHILPFYDYATCSEKDSLYRKNEYPRVWNTLGIPHEAGDTCYNWGYDPENYNVPEERYSMTPTDYVNRIKEVKTMINEFHKAGIRVIMDVVYNHVWVPDGRDFMHEQQFVFESMLGPISPQYSLQKNGIFWDLTGTGNTVDTDNPMISQMVLDSLRYWTDEYNMDGFRFDLSGVFSYNDMGHIIGTLHAEYPRQLLTYGEPWIGFEDDWRSNRLRLGTIARIEGAHFGAFNPKFRDALRGDGNGLGGEFGNGFIFNQSTGSFPVEAGSRGAIRAVNDPFTPIDDWDMMYTSDPEQAINYVSAHDNLALWDKITLWANANGHGGNDAYKRRLQQYANGIVLTAQGIPFIHGGEEFARYKHEIHDSYIAPDSVNAFDWNFKTNATDVFQYYADMIALRRAHTGFRMNTWEEINTNVDTWTDNATGAVFNYIRAGNNGDSWNEIMVIYHSANNFQYTPDGTGWKVAVSGSNANVGGTAVSGSVTVEGTAVTVLYKE